MPNKPTMPEVMSMILEEHAAEIEVCRVAECRNWSMTRQTVTCKILTKKSDGSEYAEAPDVPVLFPGVWWDVQDGTVGLLLVCNDDFSTWWRTGESAEPETTSTHTLSNAWFIPGARPLTDPRTVAHDAVSLEKPVAGGTVRLGDTTATKAVVHEDLLAGLNNFFTQLELWAAAVDLVTGTSFAATKAVTDAMQAAILAGSYESPSVKVED